MKMFDLSISTLILRYYLMMVIVIIAGFTGVWALALLALPIFLTCLMGMQFQWTTMSQQTPFRQIKRKLKVDDDSQFRPAA